MVRIETFLNRGLPVGGSDMPYPVSRRALLSAVFPLTSGEGEGASRPRAAELRQLATMCAANACVERHGVVCRRCADACERSAIRILARERLGAVIDAGACNGCGDCVPVCPVEAIALAPRERTELTHELVRLVAHG